METRGRRTYVYTHIHRIYNKRHACRKGGQTYEQGHAYHNSTAPKICIEFAGKVKREYKGVYKHRTKHKPCSACHTTRKTGLEESIHIHHTLIETGKQTRNVLGGDRGYYW